MMRWPGRSDAVEVKMAGVRLWGASVSIARGADEGCSGIVPFEWGCQLGMRLGGTIMVERRFVNISSAGLAIRTYSICNLYSNAMSSGGID